MCRHCVCVLCVAYRVLTVEFVPWRIKLSSRISTDRSSRGDQADVLCHLQKYNSRYLGAGWGGVVEVIYLGNLV